MPPGDVGSRRSDEDLIFISLSYFLTVFFPPGPRGVPRGDQDRGEREAGGGVSDRAPEELQTRDQAGAQAPGQSAACKHELIIILTSLLERAKSLDDCISL